MEAKTSATCSVDYIYLVDWNLGFYTEGGCLIKWLELQSLLWILKYTEQINNESSVPTCRQISRPCTGWYMMIMGHTIQQNTETSTAISRHYFIHLYQIYVALKTSKEDKTRDQVSQKAKARVVALEWKDEENLSLLGFFVTWNTYEISMFYLFLVWTLGFCNTFVQHL